MKKLTFLPIRRFNEHRSRGYPQWRLWSSDFQRKHSRIQDNKL